MNTDSPLDDRGLPEGYPFKEDSEILPRDACARLEAGDGFVLIDCREDDELKVVRVEGAMHCPLGKLMNEIEDVADDLPAGLDTPVAIICHTGRRSLMATLALRQMGFRDIRSVAGGIDLWARDIDPTLERY
ncbi:MAG TPA: sulfurtransferase [Phycisphaerales bacterium]|nr:sulfurtransferase [Phycisphaerales bacterium]